jgi:hypothetical protein
MTSNPPSGARDAMRLSEGMTFMGGGQLRAAAQGCGRRAARPDSAARAGPLRRYGAGCGLGGRFWTGADVAPPPRTWTSSETGRHLRRTPARGGRGGWVRGPRSASSRHAAVCLRPS